MVCAGCGQKIQVWVIVVVGVRGVETKDPILWIDRIEKDPFTRGTDLPSTAAFRAFLSTRARTNHEIDPSFGGWFLFPQTFFLYRNYTPSHTTSETRGQSPSGQR